MASKSFTNLNPTLFHASNKKNGGRQEQAPGTAYSEAVFPVGEVSFLLKEIRPCPKKTCLVVVENDSVCDNIPSAESSTL